MIPNGTFTFTNVATGEHRTLQVKTQDKEARFMPGKRIVALLRGPDNESDYTGFGFVEGDKVSIWRSKQTPTFTWYARLIVAASAAIQNMVDAEEPEAQVLLQTRQYTVQVSKRCLVCNRKLTDPESIRRQVGPVCVGTGAGVEVAQ